jgi:hypothetical protein
MAGSQTTKEAAMAPITRRVSLAALVIAMSLPLAANEPLDARVTPRAGYGPIDIMVQAFIERDTRNRSVEVIVDSVGFSARSIRQIDGEHGPRTKELRFRQLPAGEYEIHITLLGESGPRAAVKRVLSVW